PAALTASPAAARTAASRLAVDEKARVRHGPGTDACASGGYRRPRGRRARPRPWVGGHAAPAQPRPAGVRVPTPPGEVRGAPGWGRGCRPTPPSMAQAPALPAGFELPLEPRLPRIGSVDEVGVEERAASLAKRSIKKASKLFALELAIRMIDLTTLEGADTP